MEFPVTLPLSAGIISLLIKTTQDMLGHRAIPDDMQFMFVYDAAVFPKLLVAMDSHVYHVMPLVMLWIS